MKASNRDRLLTKADRLCGIKPRQRASHRRGTCDPEDCPICWDDYLHRFGTCGDACHLCELNHQRELAG